MKYGLICSSFLLISTLIGDVVAEERREVTEVLDVLTSLEDENARLKRQIQAQNEDLKAKIRYIEELTNKLEGTPESPSKGMEGMKLPTAAHLEGYDLNASTVVPAATQGKGVSGKSNKPDLARTLMKKPISKVKGRKTQQPLKIESVNATAVSDIHRGKEREVTTAQEIERRRIELAARARAQLAEIQRLEKLRLLKDQNQYLDKLGQQSRSIDALLAKRDKLYKEQKKGYVTVGITPLETASGVSYAEVKNAFKAGGLNAEKYNAYFGAMRHFKNILEEDIRVLSIFNK